MQKFSSLFTEDGEGGSAPPSTGTADMAGTGLHHKVTHDDLRKHQEEMGSNIAKPKSLSFSEIFEKT